MSDTITMSAAEASAGADGNVAFLSSVLAATADVAIIAVDPHGRLTFFNRGAERLLGGREDELLGQPAAALFRQLPEKQWPADAAEASVFAGLCAEGQGDETVSADCLGRAPDGSWRRLRLRVSRLRVAGEAAGHVCVATALEPVEHDLHLLQQRLSAVIESFQGGVLVEDSQGRVLLANQRFCDMFALERKPAELQGGDGRKYAVAISGQFANPEHFLASTDQAISWHRPVNGEQLAMADGRSLERDHVPIFLDGMYSGPMWIYRDVTQRKQQEQELFLLATTDPLTGGANRRTFMLRLSEEYARFRRYGTPTSLLILDVDHFKSINDIHGHAAGDKVLKALVGLCRQALRSTDTLGRLGGEEFAVLLPGCPGKNAKDVAEALRLALLSHVLWHEGVPVQVTVSIGIAEFVSGQLDGESVLMRAERALNAAKQAGRNRVSLFSETA
ncbi:sensor domain-containing diguanylate cyclase [Pseudogulbenkiania sp. MAI-1]|uniref:sensor domain-containing diguanylate cyclase n=1 Tax=Pseudogulbenkiania sp. MAI-1 TaxID=990370 RepID=UPI00045EA357|nr:sensor domain-containing diguanylate cyclase [Pseudogulbenkiania sp. MAI-1]